MANYTFLLVEDDEVDIMAVQRAFKLANILNPLFIANNGLEALDYLRGENGRKQVIWPYIVLLDLNMPQMDGLEFLTEIRKDHQLRRSPIVVLTSSKDDTDVAGAYDKQVAGYLCKPVTVAKMVECMAALGHYWALCEM